VRKLSGFGCQRNGACSADVTAAPSLRVSDTRVIAVTWFDLARSEGLKQGRNLLSGNKDVGEDK